MKTRLAKIVEHLGYEATPEHPPTHADVFVHQAQFCLEVQLRETSFTKRTATRERADARVCWLIGDDAKLDSPKLRDALWNQPAVRFRVVDDRRPYAPGPTPWHQPFDHELNDHSRIQVFANVAFRASERPRHIPADAAGWFVTASMDVEHFLREVLDGSRRYYQPGVLARRGLWARVKDVQALHGIQADRTATETTIDVPAVTEPTAPTPWSAPSQIPIATPAPRLSPESPRTAPWTVAPASHPCRTEPRLVVTHERDRRPWWRQLLPWPRR
ncbi:hypothetical protein [Fodinicola feengrottensis]|uniref:hypothetical protein n=1 Tax=Fodinicola feengrottensis TaxID=435914 RepID=UPI0031DC9061